MAGAVRKGCGRVPVLAAGRLVLTDARHVGPFLVESDVVIAVVGDLVGRAGFTGGPQGIKRALVLDLKGTVAAGEPARKAT